MVRVPACCCIAIASEQGRSEVYWKNKYTSRFVLTLVEHMVGPNCTGYSGLFDQSPKWKHLPCCVDAGNQLRFVFSGVFWSSSWCDGVSSLDGFATSSRVLTTSLAAPGRRTAFCWRCDVHTAHHRSTRCFRAKCRCATSVNKLVTTVVQDNQECGRL